MLPKYAPGEKIPGTPYVVAYTIGRGGGGHVVAVRDENLDVMRAVKLLEVDPRPGEKLEDAKKAVLNEAVVIAKLHKLCREHIVEVLFVGQTADQYAVPYIVMELIDGAPLRDLLKRRGGKLAPMHARQVGIDVLAALAAAHDHGIVHRDLKPANIMCEVLDQNRVRMKVIDFGIVGGVNQRTKRIAGTFRYAAPEQIHIQGPSPLMAQTDIYSLGCILYECLAGQGPFDAFCKTNEHFVHAHLTAEPAPISKLVPGIPPAFDVFFASMLSKDPHRRPPSARACAAQLIDLPWGKRQEVDLAKTQEMLQAAVHSVVRDHEEKRAPAPSPANGVRLPLGHLAHGPAHPSQPPGQPGQPGAQPALGSTFGPTQKDPPRTFGATLQSSGVERPSPATMLSPSAAPPPAQQGGGSQAGYQQAGFQHGGFQQGGFQQGGVPQGGYQRVGTPAGFQAAPFPPAGAPQGGIGGTMRVSQLPYAPTDGAPEPTRTSAPTPPPVNANGTDPLPNNGRRDNLSAPYLGYWQQQPPNEPDNNRDPSTFGAVAQTYRISPQARWVAIAAALFSGAVLLVAFGVWLARRTSVDSASTTNAAAAVSVQPATATSAAPPPVTDAVPSAAASADPALAGSVATPTAPAATTTAAAPTTTATTPSPVAAASTAAPASTPTHRASPTSHGEPRSEGTAHSAASTSKPRKLPGSGL